MYVTKITRNALYLVLIALTAISNIASAKDSEYFASLRYNHVSLHAEIKGIFPMSAKKAESQPHYIFHYDANGRVSEIENNSYGNPRRHPLTSFGTKFVKISYGNGLQTREYFDVNNKPMMNIRGVHKEVFKVDADGFIYQLNFFNDSNKAVESRWNIAEYKWQQKDNWVIERRYNLKGEKQPLSPYFEFADTAIEYDKQGNPKRHYNLDGDLNIANNKDGVAYYEDDYDNLGRHTKFSYFNHQREMVKNQWGYAYATKHYDEQGYYKKASRYEVDGTPLQVVDPFKSDDKSNTRAEIKRVSLSYLQALKNRKPELMKEVIHQDLHKHFVPLFPLPSGEHTLRQTSYEKLMEFAESWNLNGIRFPPEMTVEVTILDVHRDMATVKMVSDNWIEYLHLVKLDKRWQIKNMLWDYKQ